MPLGTFKKSTRTVAECQQVLADNLTVEEWNALAKLAEKPGAGKKLTKLVNNPVLMKTVFG